MITASKILRRTIAPLAVLAGLLLATPAAHAQAPGEAPAGDSEGRPFDGYFLAGIGAFAILFAVAKSARR